MFNFTGWVKILENAYTRNLREKKDLFIKVNHNLSLIGQLNYKWAFFIVTGLILAINLSQTNSLFYFDAEHYWNLRTSFEKNNLFSFLNYTTNMRGYLLPFILYLVSKLAQLLRISDQLLFELLNPIVYSLFFTILAPAFIKKVFKQKIGFYQTLLCAVLTIYFWKGYFYYPLSDFLSFIFLVTGTYFAILRKPWTVLLSGILLGGMLLIRPVYQIVLIPLVVWIVFYFWRELKLGTLALIIRGVLFFIGLVVVLSPQIGINVANFGVYSPFVQTQLGTSNDLFSQQLGWGIEVEKYESQVGKLYPSTGVVFLDKQGEAILLESGYKSKPTAMTGDFGPDANKQISIRNYLYLLLRYPVDFFTIYIRHTFNGLDLVYATPYIMNIDETSVVFRILNYSLWFLVLFFALRIIQLNQSFGFPLLLAAIFSLPSVLSIPTAIEVRFMLPIVLMMYAYIGYWVVPEIKTIFQSFDRNYLLKFIFAYCVFVSVCLTISATNYKSLEYGQFLFDHSETVIDRAPKPVVEKVIFEKLPSITTVGNNQTSVDVSPVSIESGNVYRITIDVEAVDNDVQLFYVDFYGNAEYDFLEQDRAFILDSGKHTYTATIYSGKIELPGDYYFRVISISKYPLIISNIRIELLK